MCREYQVDFEGCGHLGPEHEDVFVCSLHPSCGPSKIIKHTEEGFCTYCMADLTPNTPFHRLNYIRRNHIQQLLNLAPADEFQHQVFLNEVPGVQGYTYDSQNFEEFTGRLDEYDGHWLAFLVKSISSYIIDPELPELTENQWWLFQQIRFASVSFNIHEIESRCARVERTTNPMDLLSPAGPWLRMLKGFYSLEEEEDIVQAPPVPLFQN